MRLRKRTRELGIIRTRISQILMITGLSVGLAWQASAFAASPEASSYLGLGEDCCGEDPHPVHGIQTSDGGYVLVGKSADASGATDGFVLKVKARPGAMNAWVGPDSFQSGEWAQSVGTRGGLDGMNNVVETTNGVLIGAGFQASNDGKVHRYWASYDLQTGTKRWEAQVPSPQSNKISAFESLSPTRDGGVIVTGVLNAAPGSFEGFKSYGNPVDGQAFVAYYSAEQISGTSAPGAPTWETLIPNGMSGKSVRELPGDGAGFIAGVAGMEGEAPYLVRLSATGAIEWQQAYDNHGELTDVAVLSENGTLQGFVIVGHTGGPAGGIDGSITKVSPSGTVVWESLVGNPVGGTGPFAGLGAGNPQLIFDECWGVQGTIDGGAIVGCGTGIEGCDEYASNSAIGSECRNDPRTMWRGLVVKLDKSGQEVWSRVDSFVEGGEYLESASEYVSLSANGEVMSVVDQGFGIGILTLEASSSNRPGSRMEAVTAAITTMMVRVPLIRAMPLRLPIRVTPPMVRTQVTLPMSQTMTRQRMMQTRVMPKRGIARPVRRMVTMPLTQTRVSPRLMRRRRLCWNPRGIGPELGTWSHLSHACAPNGQGKQA